MNNQTDESRQRAHFTLIVLFAINTLNFFDRQILAAVNEPIRQQWNLGDGAMGMISTAFTLIYAFVGVPLGRWADRGERTRILSIGVAVWSLFTAASGMAWSYASLFLARIGVGIGEAACAPTANSIIGDLYPPGKRARAISVFMLGLPVGIFLSYWLTGLIVVRVTPLVGAANAWKVPFFIATIPGLILSFLALRLVEPKRGASDNYSTQHLTATNSPWRRLLTIPTLWWIIISGALHNFNAYAVNHFLPAYLGRYHGLGLGQANTISAIVLGAVGMIGLLGGGILADRVQHRSRRGRMLLGSFAVILMVPCIAAAIQLPPGAILPFILLTGAGWTCFYAYYVTVYPTIQDVVEPNLRATAMAIYFFARYILGGAFGTTVVGFLSDHYARKAMLASGAQVLTEAHRASGLHDAFLIVPVVATILSLVLLAGSFTVRRDMAKMTGEA